MLARYADVVVPKIFCDPHVAFAFLARAGHLAPGSRIHSLPYALGMRHRLGLLRLGVVDLLVQVIPDVAGVLAGHAGCVQGVRCSLVRAILADG